MEETIPVDETIIPSEYQDDNLGNEEDIEAIKAQLAEAEEAKRQLTARAHKAEAELKAKKAEAPQNSNINNGLDADAVDVKILQSQGMSDELIKELTTLAKVRGTSILATQLDPIFVAIKEKVEQEDKAKKASLPASRGSGSPTAKKGFNTPNLSEAEHKELWNKAQER